MHQYACINIFFIYQVKKINSMETILSLRYEEMIQGSNSQMSQGKSKPFSILQFSSFIHSTSHMNIPQTSEPESIKLQTTVACTFQESAMRQHFVYLDMFILEILGNLKCIMLIFFEILTLKTSFYDNTCTAPSSVVDHTLPHSIFAGLLLAKNFSLLSYFRYQFTGNSYSLRKSWGWVVHNCSNLFKITYVCMIDRKLILLHTKHCSKLQGGSGIWESS